MKPSPLPLSARRVPSLRATVAVAVLMACYAVLATGSQWNKTVTYDEPCHITGGYTYWKFCDFRIQPENGNLPQRWAALPLVLGNYRFPSLDDPDWRTAQKDRISPRFLFEIGNDGSSMLRQSRAMITVMGLAVAVVVFRWTRRLLGTAAALVSLTLCVFCPTMIAHGGLATSDMTATLFFLGSVACIWTVLHRVTIGTLASGAVVVGSLFLSKFSAPLVVVMGLALLGLHLAAPVATRVNLAGCRWRVRGRLARVAVHSATGLVFVAVTWAMIWAAYGFRFSMLAERSAAVRADGDGKAIDRAQYEWETLAPSQGDAANRLIRMALRLQVLPEAYLFGGAHTRYFAGGRSAFMNGQFSREGWAMFFPYCLAVKTPLTLWILVGMGCWAAAKMVPQGETSAGRRRSWVRGLYRSAPLWVLFVVYWAFALVSSLNIGHRHLLPTYPVMFMLAGAAAAWLQPAKTNAALVGRAAALPTLMWNVSATRRHPWQAALVAVSLGLFVMESIGQWPNYLAYFNPLAGGTRHAYRHLVDSSLDWGQDLPALARWLEEQGLDATPERVYLSYFGTGDPGFYGIRARLLPCYWPRAVPQFVPRPLTPGVYCVSATMLQQVYSLFPGRWRPEYEKTYQQLTAAVARYSAAERDPESLATLVAATGGQAAWLDVFARYEHARFARLCRWLQRRDPDASINGTILVFLLTAADLDAAL